eukprot:872039-Pyramimonas_sp.AAC.1
MIPTKRSSDIPGADSAGTKSTKATKSVTRSDTHGGMLDMVVCDRDVPYLLEQQSRNSIED